MDGITEAGEVYMSEMRQPVEGTADDAALACYQVGEKIPVFLPAATLIPRLMIKQAF